MTLFTRLLNDDAGFIVSAELIIVATLCVLGMVVGLSELAWNVNNELEDVGSAISAIDQSYTVRVASGHKGCAADFSFHDCPEEGGGQYDLSCDW